MEEEIKTKKRYKKKYLGKAKKVEGEKVEVELLVIGEPEEVDVNFSKFFTAFTARLMINKEITGKAVRLLFWIISNIGMNRLEFYMSENAVCSDLNITRATYYRWKKALEREGIIIKLATNYYMINPACVVKGKGYRLIDSFRRKIVEQAKRKRDSGSGQGKTTTPETFDEKNFKEVI